MRSQECSKFFGLPLLALVSALAAGNASAQSAGVNQGGLAEIVVTAQKREQSVNDVPISITVSSGEQLVQRGVSSTADLAKLVPGLTAQSTGYNTTVYNLRGVGFYDTTLSAAPTVVIYTDEIPLPFSSMTVAAGLDVQRVEVLKGPQGTLFGNNTTGGAINYIANKPTDNLEAGIDASYGRFSTVDLQGYVSGRLAEGLKARIAARSITSGDWQYSTSRPGDSLGAQRKLQGRILVDWEPTERLSVNLNVNGWRDKSDTQAAQLKKIVIATPGSPKIPTLEAQQLAPPNPRAADWNIAAPFGPHVRNNKFWQASARINYQLTDELLLTSISAYQQYRGASHEEYDGTPLRIADANPKGRINTLFQELRILGDFGDINFTFGGNYQRDKTYDQLDFLFTDATASTVGPISVGRTGSYTRQNMKTLSVFANVEWEVMERLTIEGGIRYTDNKRSFEGCSLDVTDPPGDTYLLFNFLQPLLRTDGGFDEIDPDGCFTFRPGAIPYNQDRVTNQLNEDNVAWRAGVNYRTGNRGLVYATVSKGYKSGSFPTAQATQDYQYDPIKQESLIAYEFGFKQPLLENRLRVNAAAFYYDYSDKQIRGRQLDLVFGPLDALVSIPKSRVWGLEAEFVAQPSDNYYASIAASYLDTKIKEFVGFDSKGTVADFSGSRFPYAPKWQIVADHQIDVPINDDLVGFLGNSLTYNSSTSASIGYPVDYEIPDFVEIDVRAGVESVDGDWRFELWGRNVTNEYHWTNVALFDDSLVKYAARPATYGARFSYKFR